MHGPIRQNFVAMKSSTSSTNYLRFSEPTAAQPIGRLYCLTAIPTVIPPGITNDILVVREYVEREA
jgi:hypothetical protein